MRARRLFSLLLVAVLTSSCAGGAMRGKIRGLTTTVDDAEKNDPAVYAGMSSTLNETGHRDFLARVTSMTHK